MRQFVQWVGGTFLAEAVLGLLYCWLVGIRATGEIGATLMDFGGLMGMFGFAGAMRYKFAHPSAWSADQAGRAPGPKNMPTKLAAIAAGSLLLAGVGWLLMVGLQ